MKILKLAGITVAGLAVLLVAAFLNYYLPSTTVIKLTGTDTKRMDAVKGQPSATVSTPGATRDVRFIMGHDLDGASMVFRNEDTRWSFPFYFKFNSADITADASTIMKEHPDAHVLVTHYGWRFNIWDSFPNVVKLRIVEPGYVHIPWFNLVFLSLLLGGSAYGAVKIRRLVKRVRGDTEAIPAPAEAA